MSPWFAGVGHLVRFITRRDRVGITIWSVLYVLLPLLTALAFNAMAVEDPGQWEAFVAESRSNPIVTAAHGPVLGSEPAVLVAWRSLVQALLVSAIGSFLIVVRHTRADEQAGRGAWLRSTGIGRLAPPSAAMVVVLVMNLLDGALLALLLTVVSGFPAAGSVCFASIVAANGVLFGALAAASAELFARAGAARASIVAALVLSWFLRGVAHFDPEGPLATLAWLTPFGWAFEARSYVDDRLGVLVLFAVTTVLMLVSAGLLRLRRDLHGGFWPGRGLGVGAFGVSGVAGLAIASHAGALIAAGSVVVLLSVTIGAVGSQLEGMLASSPMIASYLGVLSERSMAEAFVLLGLYVTAVVIAIFATAGALRPLDEEIGGRMAWVFSTPVERGRWMMAHQAAVLAGAAMLLVLAGLAAASAFSFGTRDPRTFGELLCASLAHIPAVWASTSVVAALVGIVPRSARWLGWGYICGSLTALAFWEGGVVPMPLFTGLAWTHPTQSPSAVALVALACGSLALCAAGLARFRRRDLLPRDG